MKKVLFVSLFFVIGFNVFANDRAVQEANRAIRDFSRAEALLGQVVPIGFERAGANVFRTSEYEFRRSGENIAVNTGANDRIILVVIVGSFFLHSEAVRFTGLMHDFVSLNGGQRVQIYLDGTGYRKRNLHVRVQVPQRHPDGGFVAAISIERW